MRMPVRVDLASEPPGGPPGSPPSGTSPGLSLSLSPPGGAAGPAGGGAGHGTGASSGRGTLTQAVSTAFGSEAGMCLPTYERSSTSDLAKVRQT